MTGEELRYRREMIGLTQEQLAQRLGLSRSTVQRFEAGSYPISRTVELAMQALELEFK